MLGCSLAFPALSRLTPGGILFGDPDLSFPVVLLSLALVLDLQQIQLMKSCRSSSRRKRRRRTMRKLFKKLETGMTGKIHTREATAIGRTWADAVAAESRAWKSCQNCLCLGDIGINALYIRRGVLGFSGSHWSRRSKRDNLLWFT